MGRGAASFGVEGASWFPGALSFLSFAAARIALDALLFFGVNGDFEVVRFGILGLDVGVMGGDISLARLGDLESPDPKLELFVGEGSVRVGGAAAPFVDVGAGSGIEGKEGVPTFFTKLEKDDFAGERAGSTSESAIV
jgi:hypothetical protein